MKNYSTRELIKELGSRGYETFDPKVWAVSEFVWAIDSAIDIQTHLREVHNEQYQLDNDQLMRILNDTLSSDDVIDYITKALTKNIYENLIEE